MVVGATATLFLDGLRKSVFVAVQLELSTRVRSQALLRLLYMLM